MSKIFQFNIHSKNLFEPKIIFPKFPIPNSQSLTPNAKKLTIHCFDNNIKFHNFVFFYGFGLKEKIVLITGASSGIGEACSYLFAEQGANLILLARRKNRLEEIAADIIQKFNVRVHIAQCDVKIYSEVENAINSIPDEFKNIDVLINNAGLARGIEKIQVGLLENWEEMLDTNVKGLLYVTRLVLPTMLERNYGDIINIGSIAGHEVYPGGNVYCGTKHAERAISKGITIDTNGYNIRVCSIDPGMVETEFSLVRFHGNSPRAKQVYEGLEPLTANDVADAALYVVSRPRYVNIQSIVLTPTAQANTTILKRNN